VVQSPHGTYPPLRVRRTPRGGWQLDNAHVILLSHAPTISSSATAAAAAAAAAAGPGAAGQKPAAGARSGPSVCEQHFGEDAGKLP
jgi:hypothetical protein